MNDHRRAPRREVGEHIEVLDLMTDAVIGRIGNLSQGGMLLICNRELVEDGLYQFRFGLGDAGGRRREVSVGSHVLWVDDGSAPGQHWVGLRFIDIATPDADFLRLWAEAPGSRHV
ncbi:MAG: PilZ domain-containing protein [Lysobacteraceae bacterium]